MVMLSEWIKSLIFLTVFAALMEMLLPNNDMKKFVRLLIGLFIVVAILRPLSIVLSAELPSSAEIFSRYETRQVSFGPVAMAGVEEKQQAVLYRIYCRELEKKIRETLSSLPQIDVQMVEVAVDNDKAIKAVYIIADLKDAVSRIQVKLSADQSEKVLPKDVKDKIRQKLYNYYQLSAEKIFFR